MALLGRKKIGREDHEKKQRRIDRLAGHSLVVDLQKEKSDNMNLEVKVMSPRSIQAQASKMT